MKKPESTGPVTATIYLPGPHCPLVAFLAPRSGIVGTPCDSDGERHRIYYEGNLHRAVNLGKWAERVRCAAGRLFTRYPTAAFTLVEKDLAGLVAVGSVTAEHARARYQVRVEPAQIARVAEYAGEPACSIVDVSIEWDGLNEPIQCDATSSVAMFNRLIGLDIAAEAFDPWIAQVGLALGGQQMSARMRGRSVRLRVNHDVVMHGRLGSLDESSRLNAKTMQALLGIEAP